jgi:hypothetical protein
VEEIFTNLDSSVSKVEKYKLRLDLHQNYKLTEAVPPAVQSTNSVGWMFSFLWNLDTSPSEKDESREVLMYFEDADRDAASQIQTIMWGGLLFLCLGAVVAEFVSWVRGGKEA